MITALRYWIDGQMASRENNIQNPGRGCWILDCWAMFGLWLSNFERDGICALILFTVRVDVSSTRGLTRATSLSIWGIDSPSLSEGSTVPTAWSLSLSFLPFECNLIPCSITLMSNLEHSTAQHKFRAFNSIQRFYPSA